MRLGLRLDQTDQSAGGGRLHVAAIRTLSAVAALTLAACQHTEPVVTGSVSAAAPMTQPAAQAVPATQTIAFESIDGPPRPVFERLVAVLSAEAEARELPVISRTGPAAYRVRAYLAPYVEKKKQQATLAWAWEVFDSQQNRLFRLTGEEPLGKAGADVWAQCDDEVLLRVATDALQRLVARLTPASPPEPPAPAPKREPEGPAVASIAGSPMAFADLQL